MGLLVSILVACVCVAELIGFYAHVRRSLLGSDVSDGDLETIVLNYKGQLASKYRRILTTIYEEDRGVETNYSLSTSPGIIFSSNTNLMTSATDDVTTQKGGASPKKEKFGEPPPKNESADVNHKGASSSRPFPTSEPSEEEPASGPMGMNVEDDPPPTAKLGKITTFTIDYDGITSPSPSKLRLGDGGGLAPPTTSFPAENDRTFAPVLLQSEAALWDSLGGAGENFTPALRRRRRSRSFSPESDALQVGGDALRKVASATQLVPEDYWRRSPSPFRRVLTGEDVESAGEDVIEQFRLVGVVLDDGFKDSLDGVNEERKREFRKKRKANRVTEVAESFVVSGASEGEAVAPPRSPSAKCEASTSGGGGEKPEPFWVNQTNGEAGLK